MPISFQTPTEFAHNPLELFEKEARLSREFDDWVSKGRHRQCAQMELATHTKMITKLCASDVNMEPMPQVVTRIYDRPLLDFAHRSYYRVSDKRNLSE